MDVPSLKKTSDHRKHLVLWTITAASFLTPFNGAAVNVALPLLARDLQLGAVALGWVNLAYLLAAAILLVPFGRIGDLWGRKRVFVGGLMLFTAASGGLVAAGSEATLLLWRALQGLGGAMTFACGLPLLIAAFPESERGQAIGINVAGVYLGLTAGPLVGGLLSQHLGWRAVFAVNIPLCLLVLALVWRGLPADPKPRPAGRLDAPGAILYATGLFSLLVGFSRIPQPDGVWLTLAGAVLLALFIFWERRTRQPILPIDLFTDNRVFLFSNLAALINYGATFAVVFLLSLYLQYGKGLSPQTAGLVLAVQPAMQTVFSPLTGRLSDRIEPRLLASGGMALTALVLTGFRFLNPATPLPLVIAGLAAMGTSFAFFSSPNTNAIVSSVEPDRQGVAAGTLGTMRLTGQLASMAIATLIFSLFLGRQMIGPDNVPHLLAGLRTTFTACALLCLAGILASLARGRRSQDQIAAVPGRPSFNTRRSSLDSRL